eukprot:14431580-Alexandrium_andersonii.AAC.1
MLDSQSERSHEGCSRYVATETVEFNTETGQIPVRSVCGPIGRRTPNQDASIRAAIRHQVKDI